MKKRSLIVGSAALGIATIIVIAYYLNPDELLKILLKVNPTFLIPYLLISILIMSLLVFRWRLVLKMHKHSVPFRSLFGYRLAGYAVNYLTPTFKMGGEPVRAFLLGKSEVSLPKAISSVILDDAFELTADVIIAGIGFVIMIVNGDLSTGAAVISSIAIITLAMILIRFFYLNLRGHGSMSAWFRPLRKMHFKWCKKLFRHVRSIEREIVHTFRYHKREFIPLLSISAGLWIFMFLEYYFALRIFGYTPNIKEIFFILSFVAIAYVIPVPAALGVLEASQVAVFSILGIPLFLAFALSMLIRSRDIVWTATGLGFLSHFGMKKIFFKDDKQ